MNEKYKEPEWDPMYVKMLDAIIEYMDNDIAPRGEDSINQRDVTIIRALVEFYDFEVQDNKDLADIMEDVAVRADQLEEEELKQNGSH